MMWNWWTGMGILLKKKLVDPDMVYETLGKTVISTWTKWKPIIIENRRLYNGPDFMVGYEYLAGEMKKIQDRREVSWEPPKTGPRYIPSKQII